jgi:hypothetical protein
MEAALRLMGIDRTTPAIEEIGTQGFEPSTSYWTGRKVGPASTRSGDSTGSDLRRGTPLSRLSSALGGGDEVLSPSEELEDVSPELAAAALRAFDEREAEQVRALSLGKAQKGYTSPNMTIRRSSGRRASGSGSGSGSQGEVVKSESISTLWSVGSGAGSRPNSGEVVRKEN